MKSPYCESQVRGLFVDPLIDGVWARAYDADKREVLGSPADVGRGPWSIESGWTVTEIASGLLMGLPEERRLPFYRTMDKG
jgi:hypothetical protein